jgi:HPt (histidine-containing phosphotransfer) domain-containing protein
VRERSLELGLSGVLRTPADCSLLLDGIVRALSREFEMQPCREHAAGAQRREAKTADPLAELPGLDHTGALKRLGGNRTLLVKLLHEFRDEFGGSAAAIREALERGEPELARRLSHTLKGVAGNLSAVRVHAAALALERAVADGADREGADCKGTDCQGTDCQGTGSAGACPPSTATASATGSALEELACALRPLVEGIERLPAPVGGTPCVPVRGPEQARLAAEITELERLLSKNSLGAKRQFAKVRGMFPAGGFLEELNALEGCMEKLDFKKARLLLAGLSERIVTPAPEGKERL